jgi:hypothetical protein
MVTVIQTKVELMLFLWTQPVGRKRRPTQKLIKLGIWI